MMRPVLRNLIGQLHTSTGRHSGDTRPSPVLLQLVFSLVTDIPTVRDRVWVTATPPTNGHFDDASIG